MSRSDSPQFVIAVGLALISSAEADVIYVDDDTCSDLSDCCFAQDTPGCDDQGCEAIVCADVPSCCDVEWSWYCVRRASQHCGICTPSGGSGTAQDPYCSIQTAIDHAVDTDEIIIAPGTYYFDSINFLGKAITVRSSGGADVTIIDATGSTGSVVKCATGEEPNTVLKGVTVTGALTNAGGGMYNDGSSPTIVGCVFSNNVVDQGAGGGMYNRNASPSIVDCTFEGNYATYFLYGGVGGGMYNDCSSPTLIGCTFRGNIAGSGFGFPGGGVYNDNSNPVIVNCLFDANLPDAMQNYFSSPTVTNCTVYGHPYRGIVNYASNPLLTNCILWANDFDQIDDIQSSSSTVSYSNVQGGWSGAGSNNLDADPLFVQANPSNCCVLHVEPGCDDPVCELAVCDAEPLCCDESVGVLDLIQLLSQLGPCSGSCWADMDHDGMVGVTDLLIVLANWDA